MDFKIFTFLNLLLNFFDQASIVSCEHTKNGKQQSDKISEQDNDRGAMIWNSLYHWLATKRPYFKYYPDQNGE